MMLGYCSASAALAAWMQEANWMVPAKIRRLPAGKLCLHAEERKEGKNINEGWRRKEQ